MVWVRGTLKTILKVYIKNVKQQLGVKRPLGGVKPLIFVV